MSVNTNYPLSTTRIEFSVPRVEWDEMNDDDLDAVTDEIEEVMDEVLLPLINRIENLPLVKKYQIDISLGSI